MDSAHTEIISALPSESNARARLKALRARWYVLALGTLLGAGVGWIWVVNQPKVYEARATLQFDFGNDDVIGDPAANGETAPSFRVGQELIRTHSFLLKSRSVAEKVVRKLSLATVEQTTVRDAARQSSSAFEQAVEKVQSAVDVLPVPGTRVVTVRARAAKPSDAAQIANAVVDAYLEKSMEDRVGASSRALEWLQAEQNSLKHEVEASERAVFKFREEHHALSASLAERRALIADERQKYHQALTELRIKRVHAQARVTILKEALAPQADPLTVQSGPIAADATLRSLRERYRVAEAQLRERSSSVSADVREVTSANTQLETLRAEIVVQLHAIVGGAQADLKEIEGAEVGLQQSLAEVEKRSLHLSREELEVAGIEREHESRRERYAAVLERAAKADLTRAVGTNTARIVDRAVALAAPASATSETMLGLGAIVGLLLATFAVWSQVAWARHTPTLEGLASHHATGPQ